MKYLLTLATIVALAQATAPTQAEQLQDAARKGDAVVVRRLLDEGVDVNTKFRYGATALFYACDHGHLEVVKVLLDKGADLTLKDSFYGFTPLMLAVSPAQKRRPEHTEIAKLLIAKGAPGTDAALEGAIDAGDVALVKFILDRGPIPADKLSEGLEAAKAENKNDIVAVLEQAGAKLPQEFKIDSAQLGRFAGSYKSAGGAEITIAVAGARLTIGPPAAPPAQRTVLAAKDATTFRGINTGGLLVTFNVEADNVTGFRLMPPQGNPTVYTRVEGK